MFTGIVEERAEVIDLVESATGWQLHVINPFKNDEILIGESIAVNGCCLTVVKFNAELLCFDLLQETLKRTNLAQVGVGTCVNLERSMKANGRFGGHFVQGHVDSVLPVVSAKTLGADLHLELAVEPAHAGLLVAKGSIAINGVSLTVGSVGKDRFEIWLIPHTRSVTNLGVLNEGDLVNVEYDVLGKYVQRQLEVKGE